MNHSFIAPTCLPHDGIHGLSCHHHISSIGMTERMGASISINPSLIAPLFHSPIKVSRLSPSVLCLLRNHISTLVVLCLFPILHHEIIQLSGNITPPYAALCLCVFVNSSLLFSPYSLCDIDVVCSLFNIIADIFPREGQQFTPPHPCFKEKRYSNPIKVVSPSCIVIELLYFFLCDCSFLCLLHLGKAYVITRVPRDIVPPYGLVEGCVKSFV